MELYLTFKKNVEQPIENQPAMVEIDFLREIINVGDELVVRKFSIELGLNEDAFDFLLNGEDSYGGDYELTLDEIEDMKEELGESFNENYRPSYYSAQIVLKSLKSFFLKYQEYSKHEVEITEFLDYCIVNNLLVTTHTDL